MQVPSAGSGSADHNVYDATSRSVVLPLHSIPASLVRVDDQEQFASSQRLAQRHEIDFAGKGCPESRGFVLSQLFSMEECDALVRATECTKKLHGAIPRRLYRSLSLLQRILLLSASSLHESAYCPRDFSTRAPDICCAGQAPFFFAIPTVALEFLFH